MLMDLSGTRRKRWRLALPVTAGTEVYLVRYLTRKVNVESSISAHTTTAARSFTMGIVVGIIYRRATDDSRRDSIATMLLEKQPMTR